MSKDWKFSTQAVHIGSEVDKTTGAVMPPIYQTSTFAQSSPGVHQGYEYTRSHNPTRTRLESCLAALEQAKFALVVASGLAALDLILHSLPKNSNVLAGNDLYGGSFRLFNTVHTNHNFKYLDLANLEQLEAELKANRPALLWLESLTNPLLKVYDLVKIAKLTKEHNCLLAVDNTMLSPYFFNPLKIGADLVMHSATKYINGHSDVVAGAMMMNDEELYQKLFYLQNSVGTCHSPFDSWLVLRGVKTLSLRMEKAQKNAFAIANYLEQHPKVEKLLFAGLTSHPQHNLAQQLFTGYGSIISFWLKGDVKATEKLLSNCQLFTLAESLGGIESLIESPAIMTHASIPKAEREKTGISDNLIRLSVGIEDAEDLVQDLEQALTL